jgi:IS30 family transposase
MATDLNKNTDRLALHIPGNRKHDTVTDEEIDSIMHRFNHRPRKSLGY